ncbi:MAG: redoxin domain-containing protein [Actinomycetales bacterium]|nr:redoxin domain-containing protein [Actinomycetales bacterium]
MSIRLRTALPLLAGSALLLAACSSTGAAAPDPSTTPTASAPALSDTSPPAGPPSAAAEQAGPAVSTALAFRAKTVDGQAFDAAALAGKPVVIWFWAPWCTVCRAESPDVAKVAAEFKDRVTFVGIAGLGPVNDMRAFVSETKTGGFTHLADVDGSLWARFGVVAQPSFVFITPSGEAQEFTGGLGENDLRNVANQLLAT